MSLFGGTGDEGNDDKAEVGLFSLFDKETHKERVVFDVGTRGTRCISTEVFAICDSFPGALQSGHYVWPASVSLAKFMVKCWESLPRGPVVELGTGVGVAGITAAQLTAPRYPVVLTDHDQSVLEVCERSISKLKETNPQASGCLVCERLSWGSTDSSSIRNAAERTQAEEGFAASLDGFALVLGADVIYDERIVKPLFQTANSLLNEEHGVFLMSSSFLYDMATEAEIDACCTKSRLNRSILIDEGCMRLQMFSRK
eukprot:369413_1